MVRYCIILRRIDYRKNFLDCAYPKYGFIITSGGQEKAKRKSISECSADCREPGCNFWSFAGLYDIKDHYFVDYRPLLLIGCNSETCAPGRSYECKHFTGRLRDLHIEATDNRHAGWGSSRTCKYESKIYQAWADLSQAQVIVIAQYGYRFSYSYIVI